MRGVAFSAADIVAPVITAAKVVVILLSRMAGQTGVGDRLGVHPFERSDLRLIAARFDVFLSGTVARFASNYLSFPGGECVKAAVLRPFEAFELRFVTRRAGFCPHIVVSGRRRGRSRLSVTAGMLRYGA